MGTKISKMISLDIDLVAWLNADGANVSLLCNDALLKYQAEKQGNPAPAEKPVQNVPTQSHLPLKAQIDGVPVQKRAAKAAEELKPALVDFNEKKILREEWNKAVNKACQKYRLMRSDVLPLLELKEETKTC